MRAEANPTHPPIETRSGPNNPISIYLVLHQREVHRQREGEDDIMQGLPGGVGDGLTDLWVLKRQKKGNIRHVVREEGCDACFTQHCHLPA